MEAVKDISIFNLFLGYLLLFIPLSIFGYYKTGLVKDTVIAFLRMTLQLFFVGIYLKWIFQLNNPFVNIGWVLLMVLISALTIGRRTKMQKAGYIMAFFVSVLVAIIIIDTYFLGLVIKLKKFFDARYFVPITGMILGNFLKSNVIAINSFYSDLQKNQSHYRFILANGGTLHEAVSEFIGNSLKMAFNPIIASAAVTGLIALPGMMTGQILGGSLPLVAIKYQIMLIITIFVGSMITVFVSLQIINRTVFDQYDRFRSENF